MDEPLGDHRYIAGQTREGVNLVGILRDVAELRSRIEVDVTGSRTGAVAGVERDAETVHGAAENQEAVREGQKVASEIKETARNEGRDLVERAKEELARDVDKAKVQLKLDIVKMTLAATEKMINEKLDEAKHREMIEGFISDVEKI